MSRSRRFSTLGAGNNDYPPSTHDRAPSETLWNHMSRTAPERRRLVDLESTSRTSDSMPPPTNTRERMRSFLNNIRQNESSPATDASSALQRLESLDRTLIPVPSNSAARQRATPGSRFLRGQQQRSTNPREVMEENSYATLAELEAAGERLRSVNEEVRELLARPIVTEALARRGLAVGDLVRSEDGQASRKRRRIQRSTSPQTMYPRPYGYHGQAVPTILRMEVMSSDGGTMPPYMTTPLPSQTDSLHVGPWEYSARNVLRPDRTVYCTSASKCNMVLCHEAESLFTLSKLVVKAPKTGYTHPLQQGLVFVGLQKDEVFASTRDYKITNLRDSHFGSFVYGKMRHPHEASQQPVRGTPLAEALTPQRVGNRDELRPDCDRDQEPGAAQDEPYPYHNSEDDSEGEQDEGHTIDSTLLQLPQTTDSESDSPMNEDEQPDRLPRAPTPPVFESETGAFNAGLTTEGSYRVEAEDQEEINVALDELFRRGTQAQARRNTVRPSATWQTPPYPEPVPMPQQQERSSNPATPANVRVSHVATTTSITTPPSTMSLLSPLAHFHLRATPNPSSRPRISASTSRRREDSRPQPVHVGEFAQPGLHNNHDEPEFVSDYSETPPPPDPSEPMRILTPYSPPRSLKQPSRKTSHGDGISTTKVMTKLSKDGCSVTITFSPPVSARYLLIKMWRENADIDEALALRFPDEGTESLRESRRQQRMWARLGEEADQGNIDVERVEAWGTQGRVWVPSETIL